MTEATSLRATLSLRRRFYIYLEPRAWSQTGLSPANLAICILIVVSAALAILETEKDFLSTDVGLIFAIEKGLGVIFLTEYILRLWICVEDPRYGGGIKGRLRYAITPAAILDLLAILPVLLAFGGSEVFLLRLFRLVRVLRLARLGRFSKAIAHIGGAVRLRAAELLLSLGVALLLLIISSALLYLTEGTTQPDVFGSIPRAMWWSVVTLTTVGYGDAYPVTILGRIFAAVTAIAGIGLIAMPTGILAAAFSEVVQKELRQKDRA